MMYKGGITPYQLCFFCIFIILSACSNTPIEDYLPKDQEEKNIMALLVRYQEARKRFHLEQYLGCLHEQGSYHHASRVMLSKKALAEQLPGFWAELREEIDCFFSHVPGKFERELLCRLPPCQSNDSYRSQHSNRHRHLRQYRLADKTLHIFDKRK